jgi:hypothetical protein
MVYGHARLKEIILGGTTDSILRDVALSGPVAGARKRSVPFRLETAGVAEGDLADAADVTRGQ